MAVCAGGIVGMIVGSVTQRDGLALTFGLVTVVAVLCLIVATAVAGAGAQGPGPAEQEAAALEERVRRLVASGATEQEVRDLVRDAVRLGQGRREGGD